MSNPTDSAANSFSQKLIPQPIPAHHILRQAGGQGQPIQPWVFPCKVQKDVQEEGQCTAEHNLKALDTYLRSPSHTLP